MKLMQVALITAGVCAVAYAGYIATLTAVLVKAHNEGNEVEEVRQVI
jgi:hypothetical protein